jgi:hypothetical protein
MDNKEIAKTFATDVVEPISRMFENTRKILEMTKTEYAEQAAEEEDAKKQRFASGQFSGTKSALAHLEDLRRQCANALRDYSFKLQETEKG